MHYDYHFLDSEQHIPLRSCHASINKEENFCVSVFYITHDCQLHNLISNTEVTIYEIRTFINPNAPNALLILYYIKGNTKYTI